MELIERTRAALGAVGIWLPNAPLKPPVEVERRETRRLDTLGYGSLWSGEGVGVREALAIHGILLGDTRNLVFGTGIANVWSRPASTLQAGAATLAAAHPGRFVLGVGIGHAFQAARTGGDYRPLSQLRDYLSTMDAEAAENPPAEAFPRVLAAVGPRMLELARERTEGAHPFFTPVEHTAFAREVLGPDKLLIPQLHVLLETDPVRARESQHDWLGYALGVKAYANAWRRFGYEPGLSDRFIDAAVAWGDEEAIARRVREQLDAGADHVLVTPSVGSLPEQADMLEKLAPALLEVAR
ncbi:TIGR03620 family F420-dependent LLM class oxidoreductase [Amycolatopsis albispora]|uniref:LLM class F420-dependent oxidoreductase n=1 Tax=Amycolatopsis albispora TaxID=1804986 RepID=A0A344L8Y1_9PSEU|nr:TIGR03620 family F420-dependent LLM class oxidoreductase [Amycolatopsis albispora]AXB44505.1 LLM class F420-dependent oxidoreductase [Amycolatopsis albispora]